MFIRGEVAGRQPVPEKGSLYFYKGGGGEEGVWFTDCTQPGDAYSLKFSVSEDRVNTIVVIKDLSRKEDICGMQRPATLEELTAFVAKARAEEPDNPLTAQLGDHVSRRILDAAQALGISVMSQSISAPGDGSVT